MLVLTRRVGESILIGDEIVVTVLELNRDQVRIGIRAPRSVTVHREEVYQEILLSNQAARWPTTTRSPCRRWSTRPPRSASSPAAADPSPAESHGDRPRLRPGRHFRP